ncbi:hypothetical protein BZA77DRAFT_352974 [Pyronema omphalodes]|nr:hypothetical protein BZA77DRAFT_352974 [Pyronema omphalodes]
MEADKMRPIELQSPEDLRYLINKVRSAAAQNLSKLPPSQDPAMMKRVEELLDEYILNLFTRALPNLTINGLPPNLPITAYMQPVEEFEPFDSRLQATVMALHMEIEKRTLQVTAMRRDAPTQLRELFDGDLTAEEKRGEKVTRAWEERFKDRDEQEGLLVRNVERHEEAEEAKKVAEDGLREIQTDLTRVLGRLTRASAAANYILEKKERSG